MARRWPCARTSPSTSSQRPTWRSSTRPSGKFPSRLITAVPLRGDGFFLVPPYGRTPFLKEGSTVTRSVSCTQKLARMDAALHHREGDRVPVSDFFWGSFLARWKKELGLPADTDIYRHYDLDWVSTVPNMDPHVKNFEILRENQDEVVVRTGYEAVIRKTFAAPMPEYVSFETDTLEKMEAFHFDDPWDERRLFRAGDNQVGGVGDGFSRNLPAWVDTVQSIYPDFPVYGSICEGHEQLWRIIGTENVMLWIGLYPDDLARFIERLGTFLVEMTRAQIKAGGG